MIAADHIPCTGDAAHAFAPLIILEAMSCADCGMEGFSAGAVVLPAWACGACVQQRGFTCAECAEAGRGRGQVLAAQAHQINREAGNSL